MESPSNDHTLNVLESKLHELLAEYHKIEKEQQNREVIINSIKTTIQAIKNPTSISLTNKNNGVPVLQHKEFTYSPDISWKEKIVSFMKFKNRAVLTADIVDAIAAIETHLNKHQILNMVSGNMSDLVKQGHVKTYKPHKMKGAYYAASAWFDNNGELKEEHKPEIKEISIW